MNNDDPKKYRILENILQKVNQKYIALPAVEIKRNNKLLVIIDNIVQRMREKNTLFNNLYQNKYYGGSYYDNLKVGEPSEYDLDCLLSLPKLVQPTVEVSDKPGYVYITLNMKALQKQEKEAPKYAGLEKLLDSDNRLSTKKVRSWMESVKDSVLTGTSQILVKIEGVEYAVKATVSKSGPALTIKLQGIFDEKEFNIDVDLVPCFTFFSDQWPTTGYRQNPSEIKKTFFVVPKSPNDSDVHYWRLSFQEQEKELISDYAVMKPTIRLIKKIRDRYQHKIASYFIKTVFLWELENMDKTFWKNPLSFVFMIMLRKYSEYIASGTISYYWNQENNLIGDLSETTTSGIANNLRNFADKVERTFLISPFGIVQLLLSPSEVDMEIFKQEVSLGKKQLKQLGITVIPPQENLNLTPQLFTVEASMNEASSQSSVASSFEEITKDLIEEPSGSAVSEATSKLETVCVTLSSQQERIISLLEGVSDRIDKCEQELKQLREDVTTKKEEEGRNWSEMVKMVGMICKKVDDLAKQVEKPKEDLDFLLAGNETLKRTADFKL